MATSEYRLRTSSTLITSEFHCRLCTDLSTLIQERADMEKSYAKSLKTWSKKWGDLIEKGTCDSGGSLWCNIALSMRRFTSWRLSFNNVLSACGRLRLRLFLRVSHTSPPPRKETEDQSTNWRINIHRSRIWNDRSGVERNPHRSRTRVRSAHEHERSALQWRYATNSRVAERQLSQGKSTVLSLASRLIAIIEFP